MMLSVEPPEQIAELFTQQARLGGGRQGFGVRRVLREGRCRVREENARNARNAISCDTCEGHWKNALSKL